MKIDTDIKYEVHKMAHNVKMMPGFDFKTARIRFQYDAGIGLVITPSDAGITAYRDKRGRYHFGIGIGLFELTITIKP